MLSGWEDVLNADIQFMLLKSVSIWSHSQNQIQNCVACTSSYVYPHCNDFCQQDGSRKCSCNHTELCLTLHAMQYVSQHNALWNTSCFAGHAELLKNSAIWFSYINTAYNQEALCTLQLCHTGAEFGIGEWNSATQEFPFLFWTFNTATNSSLDASHKVCCWSKSKSRG